MLYDHSFTFVLVVPTVSLEGEIELLAVELIDAADVAAGASTLEATVSRVPRPLVLL